MAKGIRYNVNYNNYIASAIIDGNRRHVGTYETEGEAIEAREKFLLDPYFHMSQPNTKERARIKRFGEILKACKRAKTLNELASVITSATFDTLRTDTTSLSKFGYVEILSERSGKYRQLKHTFLTLKKDFNPDDLKLIREERKAVVAKYRTREKEKLDEIKGVRVFKFESSTKKSKELREKLEATIRMDRSLRKSPRNYVSGSTLSAMV